MRVTLIETSPSLRLALRRWLLSRGHEVNTPSDNDGAIEGDVVLVGADPPDRWTLAEIERGAARVIEVPFLAPEAGNRGIDFALLERTLSGLTPRERGLALRIDLDGPPMTPTLVQQSEPMRDLMLRVHRLASVDIPVLINGETGTGKELVARALHDRGPRADQPFVAVHCGAIPEELLESILFGHERGSFTDAVRRHHGHLESAGTGTVLLDEIGEMPVRLQAKLLRVLQQRTFHRVGGTEEIRLHARVVAATHRDLSAETERGEFRADLLHRISGAILVVPPLRERQVDIPPLVHQFLDTAARSMRLPVQGLTTGALDLLVAQAWPGNVRQLQNVLHRAVVLGESAVLDVAQLRGHLDGPSAETSSPSPFGATLARWVQSRRSTGSSDREIREELLGRLETALDAPHPGEADLDAPNVEREHGGGSSTRD